MRSKNTFSRLVAVPAILCVAAALPVAAAQPAGTAERAPVNQASSDVNMHPEYARTIAQTAYIWGYAMVNMKNRQNIFSTIPAPGRLFGVLPGAPTNHLAMLNDYIDPGQNFIACPNQDVVYGLGFFDMDEQPLVLQVPDFGKRFWVYAIYDQRTDQVGEIGLPYGSKPGFYMVVGPNWEGETPAGITEVIRSPTAHGNVIPRVFMGSGEEEKAALQPLVNAIAMYPLDKYTGKVQVTDWSKVPSFGEAASGGETKWVKPETFFDDLGEVLDKVPPLPGEEALYSQFRALLTVIERDADIKKAATEAVTETDNRLIADFIQWTFNGKPAGNNWNRSQHNAEWGLDYYNRTGTSRSNMFDNRPTETQYFYTDITADGEQLHGENDYSITFEEGELPPVKGFWSLTLYNEAHFFYPNALKRYSLGTKNSSLKYNDDGSLTIYAGHKSPGKDKESNWIPAPDGHFSLYIRNYWGKPATTDGSWVPPSVTQAQ